MDSARIIILNLETIAFTPWCLGARIVLDPNERFLDEMTHHSALS